jgi:hypothetical protein
MNRLTVTLLRIVLFISVDACALYFKKTHQHLTNTEVNPKIFPTGFSERTENGYQIEEYILSQAIRSDVFAKYYVVKPILSQVFRLEAPPVADLHPLKDEARILVIARNINRGKCSISIDMWGEDGLRCSHLGLFEKVLDDNFDRVVLSTKREFLNEESDFFRILITEWSPPDEKTTEANKKEKTQEALKATERLLLTQTALLS